MAAMLVDFSTATRTIPAVAGKIIRVDRLLLCATVVVPGNHYVALKNDVGTLLVPRLPQTMAVDHAFPNEKPQGNRGQALTLEASIENAHCHLWVEYRYVD